VSTVQQYRKKPVVIEAMQWTGDNTSEVVDWVCTDSIQSAHHVEARPGVRPWKGDKARAPEPECIMVDTLEGRMRANVGDWIIRGVQGEVYPCKPEIFAATYEPVSSEGTNP
jgi:hypothetical protein